MQQNSYDSLLSEIVLRIKHTQVQAVVSVNQQLLLLYWKIGKLLAELQAQNGYGARVIQQLSDDLRKQFPDMKGFSRRNLSSQSS